MKNIIVLPTYNEKENVALLVKEIFLSLPDIDIMVVDDNSPDGTAAEVENLMIQYANLSILKRPIKDGLGRAYIDGFKKLLVSEDIENVITMDSDFSHNPKYLPIMLEEAKSHDLVVGSRYIKGGGITNWELWRRFLSKGGNFYVGMLLGKKINDWSSGFNCIRISALRKINLDGIEFYGYAFLSCLKYFLVKAGAQAKEIPIIFEERRKGKSKMSGSIIREGLIAPWKILFTK